METIIAEKSQKNEVLNDFRLMVRNKIDRQKKALMFPQSLPKERRGL